LLPARLGGLTLLVIVAIVPIGVAVLEYRLSVVIAGSTGRAVTWARWWRRSRPAGVNRWITPSVGSR
jgi:hypothetical protein